MTDEEKLVQELQAGVLIALENAALVPASDSPEMWSLLKAALQTAAEDWSGREVAEQLSFSYTEDPASPGKLICHVSGPPEVLKNLRFGYRPIHDLVDVDVKLVDAPLQYQRPQAAPSEGAVKQAEVLFEKLGLAPALERRFARLEDVVERAVWTPVTSVAESARIGGIFSHLETKDSTQSRQVPHVDLPPTLLTLERFMAVVLPTAERLELQVPWHGRFLALTTAAHADAPPILKWDVKAADAEAALEEPSFAPKNFRNPVAWYVYPRGSDAPQWGLGIGTWAPVMAVVPLPTTWNDQSPMAYLSEGLVLILKGCIDSLTGCGNALFPENLKAELYGVRSVIEAYSQKAELQGRTEASACGYDLRKDACDCHVRTLKDGRWTEYQIDRWR